MTKSDDFEMASVAVYTMRITIVGTPSATVSMTT